MPRERVNFDCTYSDHDSVVFDRSVGSILWKEWEGRPDDVRYIEEWWFAVLSQAVGYARRESDDLLQLERRLRARLMQIDVGNRGFYDLVVALQEPELRDKIGPWKYGTPNMATCLKPTIEVELGGGGGTDRLLTVTITGHTQLKVQMALHNMPDDTCGSLQQPPN